MILVTSLLSLTCIPTAYADGDQVVADDTASLIANIAPDDGTIVPPDMGNSSAIVTTGDVSVTVPLDPDQPITITDTQETAASLPPVQVSLPAEIKVRPGHVGKNGTVVYPMTSKDGAHGAVQVMTDGSVRLETVMDSARSPHRFTYNLGGLTPVLQPDGSIELIQNLPSASGSVQATVGSIQSAWAVDATGNPVSTHYQVTGHGLVQVVSPDKQTTYPVVADPQVSLTWSGLVVHFNRSETNKLSIGGAYATGVLGAAAVIPPAVVAISIFYGGWVAQAAYSYSVGKCLSATLTFEGIWVPGSYSGGYCR